MVIAWLTTTSLHLTEYSGISSCIPPAWRSSTRVRITHVPFTFGVVSLAQVLNQRYRGKDEPKRGDLHHAINAACCIAPVKIAQSFWVLGASACGKSPGVKAVISSLQDAGLALTARRYDTTVAVGLKSLPYDKVESSFLMSAVRSMLLCVCSLLTRMLGSLVSRDCTMDIMTRFSACRRRFFRANQLVLHLTYSFHLREPVTYLLIVAVSQCTDRLLIYDYIECTNTSLHKYRKLAKYEL